MFRQVLVCIVSALVLANCGGNSNPAGPSPGPDPSPTTFTLSGRVTDSRNGQGLSGATIRLADATGARITATTDGSGQYRFGSVQIGGYTATASAQYYHEQAKGVNLTSNQTADFALSYIPPWSASGKGDNVFDMPRSVNRVHVVADYTKCCQNFIVYIDGDLIINELMGRSFDQPHFEGTYLTSGGVVQIEGSSGVSWRFAEVR